MSGTVTQNTAYPGVSGSQITGAFGQALSDVQNTPFTPYGGQLVAGQNGTQSTAIDNQSGLAGYSPQNTTAGTLNGASLTGYMNPYTSSVIGTSLDQLNRNLQQTQQASSGTAAQAGAFGGDRAAIQQTENTRNANDEAQKMIAGLNLSGYQNAQTQANADLNRQLTSAQGNQAAGLAGANLNNSANGLLFQMGTQGQQTSQAQDAADYGQFLRQTQYPLQQSQMLGSTVQSFNPALSGMASRQTVNPNPSTASQAAGYGTAALGLAGVLGGSGGLSGLLSSAGNGISNAYDWLTGSGGTGGTFDTSGAGDWAANNGGWGSDIPNWANGGPVGYADGGEIDDPSYLAADDWNGNPDQPLHAPEMARIMAERQGLSRYRGDDYDVAGQPVAAPYQTNLDLPSVAAADVPMEAPPAQIASPTDVPMPVAAPDAPQGDPSMPPPSVPLGLPGVARRPSRVVQSANPAASIPAPPVPPGQPQGPQGLGGMQQQPSLSQQRLALLSQQDQQGNNWAIPVLSAGLAMLGGTSPNAGVNIGQGGLAGVNAYQQQKAARAQQYSNALKEAELNEYHQGMVNAKNYGTDTRSDTAAAKLAVDQDLRQQNVNIAMIRALNSVSSGAGGGGGTWAVAGTDKESGAPMLVNNKTGEIKVGAIAMGAKPTSDNWSVKGTDPTTGKTVMFNSKTGETRLGNQDIGPSIKDQNTSQARANGAEDAAVKSIINSAAAMGKSISYADALAQVRGVRGAVGNAPIPQAPAPARAVPAIPAMPGHIPPGSQYSPSRNAWRDPQGNVYPGSP